MRTRINRSLAGFADLKVTTYRGAPNYENVGTSTAVSNAGFENGFEQIDDVVTPSYALRMAKGDLIMNPMSLRRIRKGSCGINFTAGPFPEWFSGGKEVYEGDIASRLTSIWPNWLDDGLGDLSNMTQNALTRAYANVNPPSVLSGELANDLSSTIGMLRRPFKGSVDLLAKVARRKTRYLKKFPTSTVSRANADAWLETRYGWTPLLLDMNNLVKASQGNLARLRSERLTARGGTSNSIQLSKAFSISIYGSLFAVGTAVLKHTLRSNGGVIYEALPRSTSGGLAQTLGLSQENLLTTGWEIVPYSFVADWFSNVGNWLAAVTPRTDVNYRSSWVTNVIDTELVVNGTLTYTWLGHTFTRPLPPWTCTSSLVTRIVNPAVALHPVWREDTLSTLHKIDAIALGVTNCLSLINQFRH